MHFFKIIEATHHPLYFSITIRSVISTNHHFCKDLQNNYGRKKHAKRLPNFKQDPYFCCKTFTKLAMTTRFFSLNYYELNYEKL